MNVTRSQLEKLVALAKKHNIGSFDLELWEGKSARYPSRQILQASGSTMDQYPDGPWGATWLLDGDGNAVKLKETGE